MKKQTTIKDYSGLDKKLLRAAEIEAELGTLENDLNMELNVVKEEYQEDADKLNSEMLSIQTDMELFCKDHKKDFTGKGQTKSKKLMYGTVKFKMSPGAIILLRQVKNGMKKAGEVLFAMYKKRYVRLVPEVNKEALAADYRTKKIGDLDLASANLRYHKGDVFSYSLNWAKLSKEKQLIKPVKIK